MKKILAFVLALVLCVCLGACGANASGLSQQEKGLVGVWRDTDGDTEFTLLSSGMVLYDYAPDEAVEETDVYYGHWEAESGYLITYAEKDNEAVVYQIVNSKTLMNKGCTYTKQ